MNGSRDSTTPCKDTPLERLNWELYWEGLAHGLYHFSGNHHSGFPFQWWFGQGPRIGTGYKNWSGTGLRVKLLNGLESGLRPGLGNSLGNGRLGVKLRNGLRSVLRTGFVDRLGTGLRNWLGTAGTRKGRSSPSTPTVKAQTGKL